MRRLNPQRRTENTQQMKISQVIDLPLVVDTVQRLSARASRHGETGAEDDGVQTARRDIVDPFGRELAHGVEGGEVYLFGVDEVVFRLAAEVVDVFDEEEVGGGLLG
jgi:hypothetical protein